MALRSIMRTLPFDRVDTVLLCLVLTVSSRPAAQVRADDLRPSMAQAFCNALPRLRIEFAIDHRAAGNGRALTGHRLVVIGCALVA